MSAKPKSFNAKKCIKKNGQIYLIRHVRYRYPKKISPKGVIHQLFLNIDFFNLAI